jgi:hypothetical protein
MSYWRRGYTRWQFPKLKCPDVWNPDTVVFWFIVGCLGSTNRTNAEHRAGEYKHISSKSFHGELSFVKKSVNNLLRELKPVNFHLSFPMGLSGHRIAAFSSAAQRLSTTRKLQLTAVRSRGVAVGVEKLWL